MVGYLSYVNGEIASTTPLHTDHFRVLVKFKKIACNNSTSTTKTANALLTGECENEMRRGKPPKKSQKK